jgi:ligand-binding SRPBCC domain-containing protein
MRSDTAGDGLPRGEEIHESGRCAFAHDSSASAVQRPAVYICGVPLFVYRSTLPVSAVELFRWHERPDALLDLIPGRRWVEIEEQVGGLRDGGRVIFSIGVGSLRVRWQARHFGYIQNTQFCDEQVRGPFARWRHTHRIESIGPAESLYEDRVEYLVPGGPLVNRLFAPLLQRLLAISFAKRHEIVRDSLRRLTLDRSSH